MNQTRRTLIQGVGAAILAPKQLLAMDQVASGTLPVPNSALWHLETPPVRETYAAGPNGQVYCRLYGHPGSTPVLVLHGGPAAGERYMRPYVGVAADREVVLYDQSGCGKSARPKQLALYTVDRYVSELEAVRAHFNFEKVILLGHSWGCFLGTAYAAAYPDRIAAVVLAGGACKVQDYVVAANRWLHALGPDAVAVVRNAQKSGITNDQAYLSLLGRYYALHFCRLEPMPAFLAEIGEEVSQNPVYLYLNGPSEFDFTGALRSLDVTAQLRSLRAPTLVTCGEFDEAPEPVARSVANAVPRSSVLCFQGLSHMSHIEDPARVVAATSAFMRRVT